MENVTLCVPLSLYTSEERPPSVPSRNRAAGCWGCCMWLMLFVPLAHRGLRATAKITYQAVLLENLVCKSSISSVWI